MENPLTQNLYIYALDNPLKFIDPTGHDSVQNDSDWKPVDSWGDMYSDDYQQIYKNGKGDILVSTKAYTDTRVIIMNWYYTKHGDFDHLNIKNFELPAKNASGFYLSVADTSSKPTLWGYLKSSGKQVVMGNYTDDVTLLGTGAQIVSGIFDIDIAADVRDITYDFTHWEWTWGHGRQTFLDGIGFLPGIGFLKYLDEGGTLAKEGKIAENAVNFAGKTSITPNPFKGKTVEEIDGMFKNKGFELRGNDPLNGKGGYVNPSTGRSYHIDKANSFGEPPHVDVNRLRNYKGPLDKKKYGM